MNRRPAALVEAIAEAGYRAYWAFREAVPSYPFPFGSLPTDERSAWDCAALAAVLADDEDSAPRSMFESFHGAFAPDAPMTPWAEVDDPPRASWTHAAAAARAAARLFFAASDEAERTT